MQTLSSESPSPHPLDFLQSRFYTSPGSMDVSALGGLTGCKCLFCEGPLLVSDKAINIKQKMYIKKCKLTALPDHKPKAFQ